jgi:hypothetical protein
MRVMKIGLASIALLVGCSHGRSTGADSNTCTGAAGCGLSVPWLVHPDVPSNLAPTVTIETATFMINTLDLIGDTGPVTAQGITVSWAQGTQPTPVPFANAPSGLYSKVTLQVDGQFMSADSYTITGHAVANGTMYPYTIHDRFALSVSLDTTAHLDPGTLQPVPIEVDLTKCVGLVDWNLVHVDNNVLNLDTDDDWIPVFRQLLIASFSVQLE